MALGARLLLLGVVLLSNLPYALVGSWLAGLRARWVAGHRAEAEVAPSLVVWPAGDHPPERALTPAGRAVSRPVGPADPASLAGDVPVRDSETPIVRSES
jgi:hypothetical protein